MSYSFVVTQTPLRLSFAGGGTDLETFYLKEGGQVVSTAIDKFVYVTVKRHDAALNAEAYRLNYFESEHVDKIDDIKNNIIREVLRFLKIDDSLYISTVADVPASSGLGSSSAFAVGLLHALHLLKGEKVSLLQLADEACEVEINRLNAPIGRQDQYATAFGSMNKINFRTDGKVSLEPIHLSPEKVTEIFGNFLFFSTAISRSANLILEQQSTETRSGLNFDQLRQIKEHCEQAAGILRDDFCPRKFGAILNETWQVKKTLSDAVSTTEIDTWYDAAIQAGALGGKISGAGGGGFLALVVPREKQSGVRKALRNLREAKFFYEPLGSRMVVAQ